MQSYNYNAIGFYMIWRFFKHYILFFLFCVVQKVVFWLYYYKEFYNECGFSDFADVVLHGLPLDAAIAGYLTAIPALLLIASVWWRSKALNYIFRGYYIFCAVLLGLIFVADLALYQHWGFRLDSTPLFYLKSSPKDAFASATFGMMLAGAVDLGVYVYVFWWLCRKFLVEKFDGRPVINKVWKTVSLVLLAGALFLPIRGGFTVATLNTGKVYYSQNMRLNHAAINPCFSLLESLSRDASFATQYRYLPPHRADELFARMQDVALQNYHPQGNSLPDSTASSTLLQGGLIDADAIEVAAEADEAGVVQELSGRKQLLKPGKPNVVMIILESFLSKAMGTLGGIEGVAVNLDSLGANGVLFTNFYANSFRTDRGIVSILSGYPAQPTNSIMKYPRKSQSLPSISGALARNGYNLQYVYGGDANFTNMRSYLTTMGFENIISDADFPLSQKLSKWGAHDDVMFDKIATQLEAGGEQEPFLKVIQTSSSHEPFEVPGFSKLEDERLNSIAYTDSCLQVFINRYKNTPYWENTLFVLVPDHAMQYPVDLDVFSVERYKIPLVLYGPALAQKGVRIDAIGGQIDIAATLLGQLGLPHTEFAFSKDILNPANPHFAFFTVPDSFGMVTASGEVVFDNVAKKVYSNSCPDTLALAHGKAFLQKIYDDLEKRGNKNLEIKK